MITKLKALGPGLVGGLLAAGIGWFLVNTIFGIGLVHLSADIPFALRERIQPPEAVIIYMDNESEERLGQSPDHVWDRAVHAQLLNRLTEDGAKCVVYDVFFASATSTNSDAAFAEAIRRHGNIILAADYESIGYDQESRASGSAIKLPHEIFLDAGADIGLVELNPDDDAVVREHFPVKEADLVKPLAWVAAEHVQAPITTNQQQRATRRWVNYYGPPRNIVNYAFWRVLSTNATEALVPPGAFRNKVVFVGAAFKTKLARDRKDEYSTPHTAWFHLQRSDERLDRDQHKEFMAGVEVHATVFLNLIREDWLRRLDLETESRLALLGGFLLGFALVGVRPLTSSLIAILAGVGVIGFGYYTHTRLQVWFPWAIVSLVVVPVAWGWAVLYNAYVYLFQTRRYEQSLSLYLSPKLVKKFAKDENFLKTGAEKQELSILFSDIANFTSLSEGMDGDELALLMNGYFDRAIPHCVFQTDGTVMKYIGDAIFAVWNAPDAQPDHAIRACRAALLLRDGVSGMTIGKNAAPLLTRIGLHTGPASIGNFGSKDRFGYDAVGENINLASRMEGLNKYLGTRVLITGDTFAQTNGQFITRHLGSFRLKGFEKAVEVHELISEQDTAETSQSWRESFAQGLDAWRKRSWEEAIAAFRRTLELKPEDGPARFYLDRIEDLQSHPPAGGWNGIVELKEK